MSSPFLDLDGNTIPDDRILGYGRSGVVLLCDGTAVKMPLRYKSSPDDDVEVNTEVIQREQDVYRRLGQCNGVVPCLSTSETTIQLALMENGDLRTYLARNRPPKSIQLSWFREMSRALACIHDRSVIVADIASRNFLLDSDLSIKFCDFTESSIMPPDINMETADDNGYSVQTDIGQLGAVIYEIVTGERCEFDLFEDPGACQPTWPRRTALPSTQNIWLGPIIEKCWTKGAFQNADCLSKAFDFIDGRPFR
jgi:serine/threonine protein kinase